MQFNSLILVQIFVVAQIIQRSEAWVPNVKTEVATEQSCSKNHASFWPHEWDCNKYYHCVNEIVYAGTCNDGLYFNSLLHMCAWPVLSGCTQGTPEVAPTEVYPGPTNSCPSLDPLPPMILPHNSDCSKFFICSNGQPIEFSCPATLIFNPETKICDYPENAGCIAFKN